jgi:hypothetical protein
LEILKMRNGATHFLTMRLFKIVTETAAYVLAHNPTWASGELGAC